MLVLLLLTTAASAAERLPIKVGKNKSSQIKYFDPNDPPADMPSLQPPEAAVTVSAFSCSAQMRVIILEQNTVNGICHARARIETVDISLGLNITIWLPNNPSRKLRVHEDGHKKISEHYFDFGKETAERLAQPYVGKEISGQGADCTKAIDDGIKASIKELAGKYMTEIEMRSGERTNAMCPSRGGRLMVTPPSISR